MTMRKPTAYDRINDLKNEIAKIESFMKPAVREINQLASLKRVRTHAEEARIDDLLEIVKGYNKFLDSARKEVKAFFAPAA